METMHPGSTMNKKIPVPYNLPSPEPEFLLFTPEVHASLKVLK
jgi:hypothetical protein